MREVLSRLKLIDCFTLTLNLSPGEFKTKISEIVDKETFLHFLDPFGLTSNSKNELVGEVYSNNFIVRSKVRLLKGGRHTHAVANGLFTEINGQLVIRTEIVGFSSFEIFTYIVSFIVYLFFIFIFITSDKTDKFLSLLIILFVGLFSFGLIYLNVKQSVNQLKRKLESVLLTFSNN